MKAAQTFNTSGDFKAYYAASKQLAEAGFSIGEMQSDNPIGFKEGKFDIAKWDHLSSDDKKKLSGILRSEDFRAGPVTIVYYS
jgi:hypothetical protein